MEDKWQSTKQTFFQENKNYSRAQYLTPVILGYLEGGRRGEIRRTLLGGQPGQKIGKTPISTNELGVVVRTRHPDYIGCISSPARALAKL